MTVNNAVRRQFHAGSKDAAIDRIGTVRRVNSLRRIRVTGYARLGWKD